jgi:hypothetical protein
MTYGVLVISELRRRQFDERFIGLVRVQFGERVSAYLNKEVILFQSGRKKFPAGYFAVAILLDAGVSAVDARFLYLTFSRPTYFRNVVPVHSTGLIVESAVRNADGQLNGRKFSEDFRTLREDEFLELTGESHFLQTRPPHHFDGLAKLRSTNVNASRGKPGCDRSRRGLLPCHFMITVALPPRRKWLRATALGPVYRCAISCPLPRAAQTCRATS